MTGRSFDLGLQQSLSGYARLLSIVAGRTADAFLSFLGAVSYITISRSWLPLTLTLHSHSLIFALVATSTSPGWTDEASLFFPLRLSPFTFFYLIVYWRHRIGYRHVLFWRQGERACGLGGTVGLHCELYSWIGPPMEMPLTLTVHRTSMTSNQSPVYPRSHTSFSTSSFLSP